MALATLLAARFLFGAPTESRLALPHTSPKAKRVIYLFQSGAPSQMDLFDHKPHLDKTRTAAPSCPRLQFATGQRLTGDDRRPELSFPVAPR